MLLEASPLSTSPLFCATLPPTWSLHPLASGPQSPTVFPSLSQASRHYSQSTSSSSSLTLPEVRATANEVGGSRPGTGLRSQHYHRWLDWSLNTDNMTSDHTGKNFSTCQDPVHRGLSKAIELRAWSISWPLDTSFPSPNLIYNVSSQGWNYSPISPLGSFFIIFHLLSLSSVYHTIPLHSLERQCLSKRKTFSWPCILLFI